METLFIPIFFIVTGFLIQPLVFVQSICDHFDLVAAIIGALLESDESASMAGLYLHLDFNVNTGDDPAPSPSAFGGVRA